MSPWRVSLAILVVAIYSALGVWGALLLAHKTVPGADLATYQRAAADLLATGDPHATAAFHGEEFQYRYSPLLAMLIPILGWPPLWYSILAVSTAVPIYYAYRDAGLAGLITPLLLVGAWLQTLLNGNVQPVLIALLVLTPRFARAGPVCLAVATMLKLHPALAVVWYLGRRDWAALRWYAGALLTLALIQAPWLGAFVDYYLHAPAAVAAVTGMGLMHFGVAPWLIGTAVVAVVAFRYAPTRYGWLLATVLQLVAIPRLFPVNLALVLAAPLRSRPGSPSTSASRAFLRGDPSPATR